jgi:hypothetical protein
MGNVISNLKAKFGVDTSDFKKGLKDGEKAVSDFKGAAGNSISQFASMFGIDMGAVNDAIGTAGKSLNFVGSSFKGAAAGGNVFKIALTGVKLALVSTGVGAIVVALGSLIAYFQKSGRGADQFARILAQVKSVINNVIDRLAIFGKGVYEIATGKFKAGWETMKGAFKGIGEEIKNDWKEAGNLADRLDKLEDKEIDLITSLSKRKYQSDELRRIAKEETEDQKKKLDLLLEAERIMKGVYADEVGIERERLAIMKEQLAISSKEPTDNERRKIAEQEAKINEILQQREQFLKALTREKKTAAEQVKEDFDLEVRKLKDLQNALSTIDTSNIKMPDLSPVTNALAKQKEAVTSMISDVNGSVNEAFSNMAVSVGVFLGALASGDAGASDFGKVIGSVFAELAITVGKICIAAALAKMALEKALITFGGAGVALAAGIALVAIGTAVKGSMSRAVGASSGGSSAASGGGFSYDARGSASQQPIVINITGELKAAGPDLKYVFDQEVLRKGFST